MRQIKDVWRRRLMRAVSEVLEERRMLAWGPGPVQMELDQAAWKYPGLTGADMDGGQAPIVVVMDTGVKFSHPDLAGKFWINPLDDSSGDDDEDSNGYDDDYHGWDFVNDDNDPADVNSHGTALSGIIASRKFVTNVEARTKGINHTYRGVVPDVKILPLQVAPPLGSPIDVDHFIEALEYVKALAIRGEPIAAINMSLGFKSGRADFEAKKSDINTLLQDLNDGSDGTNSWDPIILVASAGNTNSEVNYKYGDTFYPAAWSHTYSVGFTGYGGNITQGDGSTVRGSVSQADYVDILAPGAVPLLHHDFDEDPFKYKDLGATTSYATGLVTGAAVMIRQLNPGAFTPGEILDFLQESGEDVDETLTGYTSRTYKSLRLSSAIDAAYAQLNTEFSTPALAAPDLKSGSDSGALSNDEITNEDQPTFAFTTTRTGTHTLIARRLDKYKADIETTLSVTTTGAKEIQFDEELPDGLYSVFVKFPGGVAANRYSKGLRVTIDTTAAKPGMRVYNRKGIAVDDNKKVSLADNAIPNLLLTGERDTAVKVYWGKRAKTNNLLWTGTIPETGEKTLTRGNMTARAKDVVTKTAARYTFFVRYNADEDLAENSLLLSGGERLSKVHDFRVVRVTNSAAPVIAGVGDNGPVLGDGASTTDGTLLLHGYGRPGDLLTLKLGATTLATNIAVDYAGEWQFDYTGTTLTTGSYQFQATSIEEATDDGEDSAVFDITIVTSGALGAPLITNFRTGDIYTGYKHYQRGEETSATSFAVLGRATPGAQVQVLLPGGGNAVVSADGTSGEWSYEYSATAPTIDKPLDFYAREVSGGSFLPISDDSAIFRVRVDVTTPEIAQVYAVPDTNGNGVERIVLLFTEPVTGLSLGDFTLTGGAWTDQVLEEIDGTHWEITNLASRTSSAGAYSLARTGGADGVYDSVGREMASFPAFDFLVVNGSALVNDSVHVKTATDPSLVAVDLNSVGVAEFDPDVMDQVIINGLGGDDSLLHDIPPALMPKEGIFFRGGSGTDRITVNGTSGADTIEAGAGESVYELNGEWLRLVYDGTENVTVNGAAGADVITVWDDSASIVVNAGDGADVVAANAGPTVTVNGGDGNDTLTGDEANNRLNGDGGDDSIRGGDGRDSINGGTGLDQLFGEANIDTVSGGDDADSIDGGDDDDSLFGDGGIDTILGGLGHDLINGGDGDDHFFGQDGNDTLVGGAGSDALTGGNGTNYASYSTSSGGVNITLAASGNTSANDGLGGTDLLNADVQNLIGGPGNDTLSGNGNPNVLRGGDGNDLLDGKGGADTMSGGSGTDTADYSTRSVHVRVSLDGTANDGEVDAGGSQVENDNVDVERVLGGSGNDTLTGDAAYNVLEGGGGADVLDGGAGNDTLYGGEGDDTLTGGNDSDFFYGEGGNDTLYAADPDGRGDTLFGGSGYDVLGSYDPGDYLAD